MKHSSDVFSRIILIPSHVCHYIIFCFLTFASLPSFVSADVVEGVDLREFERMCAVNCLYIANKLLGGQERYEYFAELFLSRSGLTDGSSLADIESVAEAVGLYVSVRRVSATDIASLDDCVAIVYREPQMDENDNGHFLCMRRFAESAVQVIDPPYMPVLLKELNDKKYVAAIISKEFSFGRLSLLQKVSLGMLVFSLFTILCALFKKHCF